MPASPARTAVFDILLRVESTDAYASELLHSSRSEKLSPADHGLATEIVMGVLRWRSLLDEQIAAHVNQRPSAAKAADRSGTPPARLESGPSRIDPLSTRDPLSKKDPLPTRDPISNQNPLSKLDIEVITALRMGAYQLLFLDRIPAHAAINESVELVKKARKRSAAGMVNAVLRRVSKDAKNVMVSRRPQLREGIASAVPQQERVGYAPLGAEVAAAEAADNSGGPLARLESVPFQSDRTVGLQARSRSLHSGKRFASESSPDARNDTLLSDLALRAHPAWLVERWQRAYGVEAAHAVCSYDQQTPSTVIRAEPELITELASEGVQLEPGRMLSNARAVVGGDISRTVAFRDKRLVIQDEGSQLVAVLLGTGKCILDCCAAPGGKTRIIAEQNPRAKVVAMELHPHRAALISRLVPLSNVEVISADARSMPFAEPFDRILVDAPCTGTGTLARNPEIKRRLQPDDIARMQAYQVEILNAAMKQLAPGGKLLYSTCSLEPQENEAVVEQLLRDNPCFRLLNIRDRLGELRNQGTLVCDPDSLVRGPYLRTIPGVHPCDGFFAALVQREM